MHEPRLPRRGKDEVTDEVTDVVAVVEVCVVVCVVDVPVVVLEVVCGLILATLVQSDKESSAKKIVLGGSKLESYMGRTFMVSLQEPPSVAPKNPLSWSMAAVENHCLLSISLACELAYHLKEFASVYVSVMIYIAMKVCHNRSYA